MRQLKTTQRGLTLIELVIAFAIMSLLALAAAPHLSDYSVNAQLRESGNLLYAEALLAQSEAIKRNRPVRVATSGGTVTVSDMADPANPLTLRTRSLADGVSAATGTVEFGSQGWPTGFAAASVNLSHSRVACSADHRCPGLRVDAGGAIRLCGNHLSC